MAGFFKRFFRRLIHLVLAALLLAVVCGGTVLAVTGYSAYHDAVSEKPIAQAMSEVQNAATYTPLSAMPAIYPEAVVAVEDHRFYDHHGFDVIGTARALTVNLVTGETVQGGSTITQQLARNLYYTQEQTLSRKIAELITAVKIEKTYTKDDILAAYISSIYYGDGYYSLLEASMGYFGVAPQYMTDAQATLLAGVPNAPSAYAPTVNYGLAKERQRQVLDAMVAENLLSASDADAIYNQPI